MTVFESVKCKNIDELAEWLNEYGMQDFAPWTLWFDKKYCNRNICESIMKADENGVTHEYAWCELNEGKCKFFQNMDEAPYGKQIIKMWLESKV